LNVPISDRAFFPSWCSLFSQGKPDANGSLIYSFNGKPQALPLDLAYACGSPLNERDPYTTKSTPRYRAPAGGIESAPAGSRAFKASTASGRRSQQTIQRTDTAPGSHSASAIVMGAKGASILRIMKSKRMHHVS